MNRKACYGGLGLLGAFVLWTALVRCVDVRAIGPLGTRVGFASLNAAFHNLTGVHRILYEITDWLGLVPIAAALGFALLGLAEWIKRRSLAKVDRSVYPAVTNIGTRPTVAGDHITAEAWLQNFSADLYGKELTLELHAFLRPEKKFPTLQALKEEILKNRQETLDLFEKK